MQKSKKQLREELAELMNSYIRSGGEVEEVPRGKSGNEKNQNVFKHITHFEPKAERTPLTAVVKTLEERKQTHRETKNHYHAKIPKKRLVLDDFGDPVRWVWDDPKN